MTVNIRNRLTMRASQRGMTLISVVIGMLLLALLGSVVVSMVSSERFVAVNQLQAINAQYAAESGLERALRWFFDEDEACTNNVNLFDAKLGKGNYLVSTELYAPTALPLDAAMNEVDSAFVVNGDAGINGYAPYGIVIIDQEMIECAQVTSGAVSTFSGCKRGIGGSMPAVHANGNQVFQEFCIVSSTGTMPATRSGDAQRVVSIGFSQFDQGWAVGDNGTIIQWNGIEWSLLPVANQPTNRNLRDVQLTSLDQGWTAGDWGVMAQVNGITWTKDHSAHIYLPANGGANIAMLDTDSIEIGTCPCPPGGRVTYIPVAGGGATEVAVTPNGKFLYVTRSANDDVIVIDTDTRLQEAGVSIPMGVDANPQGIVMSPDGSRVYVVNQGPGAGFPNVTTIRRVDQTDPIQDILEPDPLLSPIFLDPLYPPRYAAITLDGDTLLISTFTGQPTGRVEVITGLPDGPIVNAAITVPDTDLMGIAIQHPEDQYAYVAGQETQTVYQLDRGTGTGVVGEQIPLTGDPWGISYTRDGLNAYVSQVSDNRVLAVSSASNIALNPPGEVVDTGPQGLANSADGSEIYVASVNGGSSMVNVIDVASYEIVAGTAEPISGLTGGIAANPARSFKSISMISAAEGWAVGGEGRILHWDGATWETQPLATIATPALPPNTTDNDGIWTTTIQPDALTGNDAYVRMADDVNCGILPPGCRDSWNYNDPLLMEPDSDRPEDQRLGLRRVSEILPSDPDYALYVNDPTDARNDRLYRAHLKFDLNNVKEYALSVLRASLQLFAYDIDLMPSGAPVAGSSDLMLQFQYDDGSAPINIPDSSSASNDGNFKGGAAATYASGISGNALVFDGIDDRVYVEQDVSFQLSSEVSISTWVYFSNPAHLSPGVSRELIRKGLDDNASLSYMLWVKDGKPVFTVRVSCGFFCGSRIDVISEYPPLSANQWYFLAGTYDGSKVKIYQGHGDNPRGEEDFSGTLFTAMSPGLSSKCGGHLSLPIEGVCLGGTNQSAFDGRGNDFQGMLDESQIYDRAITPGEINALSGWGNRVVDVYRVDGPWNHNAIAGEMQPSLSTGRFARTEVTADNVPKEPDINEGKWIYWPVTTLVQRWVDDTDPNYGLALRTGLDETAVPPETDPSPQGIMWFHAADAVDGSFPGGADNRPRLIVTYRVSERPNLESIAMLDTDDNGIADDGWAVGEAGIFFRYDLRADPLNLTWSEWMAADNGGPLPTVGLKSVSMCDENEGWAVGDGGTIYQFTADAGNPTGQWAPFASPTIEDLAAVSITADGGEGIAVGTDAVILSYDGDCDGGAGDGAEATWVVDLLDPAIVENLMSIRAFSDARGWGAGEDGTVVRKTGGDWAAPGDPGTVTPTTDHLRGIDMLPASATITDWREEY